MAEQAGPIGVFDSGYGGLTVFKEIIKELPQYDYIYLGDNARVPYGIRSFETVYQYTLECVNHLFNKGCRLIILACNTASAKALRTIQQKNLPEFKDVRRVLGVIRPTTERAGEFTRTRNIGILATNGTVASHSYPIEINKFYPDIHVFQQACPLWVPLVESNEHESDGADYFVKKYLDELMRQSPDIDTLILGCTHYPLLIEKIRKYVSPEIRIVSQADIVAKSLKNYLHRHPEIDALCSKNGTTEFFTTGSVDDFNEKASIFFGKTVTAKHQSLIND
ncbi:glutamate racemase [Pedobacter sp. BS3]|uniref:glutamate racemase n=1 Tax=Pedobacter sp. BS3 TaxID=2567937 RepID=UPI0011EC7C1D|nr:glutamate racemase [Pedobacter sp. BS3]TZF84573.1 glutamate racemase [Pedobacter sp. BS3]